MWFYLNGRFVEDEDAKVSVTDHSFLYGDGCFEGIGVCDGRIMHLREHVDRLFKSARMLRMEVPVGLMCYTISSWKPRRATAWRPAKWDTWPAVEPRRGAPWHQIFK